MSASVLLSADETAVARRKNLLRQGVIERSQADHANPFVHSKITLSELVERGVTIAFPAKDLAGAYEDQLRRALRAVAPQLVDAPTLVPAAQSEPLSHEPSLVGAPRRTARIAATVVALIGAVVFMLSIIHGKFGLL